MRVIDNDNIRMKDFYRQLFFVDAFKSYSVPELFHYTLAFNILGPCVDYEGFSDFRSENCPIAAFGSFNVSFQ